MKTREQMINELLLDVEDWDLDALIEAAKSELAEYYNDLDDEEIKQIYSDALCIVGDEKE